MDQDRLHWGKVLLAVMEGESQNIRVENIAEQLARENLIYVHATLCFKAKGLLR
jgi:hypothetical protein